MALAVVGTCTYNTVTINVNARTKISARPILDEAQRTIVAWHHTLNVEGYITIGDYGGSTLDADMDAIKKKLMQPAGQLTYTSKGYGNLTINVGAAKDVSWGPMPTGFEWFPVGANQTCLVNYTLEWRSPICNGTTSYVKELMAFNWDWSVSIDQQGLSTRTVSGYFEIPMTRTAAGSKLLPDCVDDYRHILKHFPIPHWFRRVSQNFRISKDKRRCDFSITDTELASQNAMPPGATDAQIRCKLHTTSAKLSAVFIDWSWEMSGTITVAPYEPTGTSWDKFLTYLNSRLAWLRSKLGSRAGVLLVPVEFDWEEDVTGLSSSFRVVYHMKVTAAVGTGSILITKMLEASGLWQPINASYAKWALSMDAKSVSRLRGGASLFLDKDHDAIVDLCVGDTVPTTSPGNRTAVSPGGIKWPVFTINPWGIWLYYRNELSVLGTVGTAYHWPLAANQKAIEHVKWDGSRCTFVMEGLAWRFCEPTPIPKLLSINGKPVKQIGEAQTKSFIIKYWGGWPVIQTQWRIHYILPETVTEEETTKLNKAVPGEPAVGGTKPRDMKERQLTISPGQSGGSYWKE